MTDRLDDLFANLPELMSVQDACDLLHISKQGMYKWLQEGVVSAYKVANTWFIVRDELKDLMRSGWNRVLPPQQAS